MSDPINTAPTTSMPHGLKGLPEFDPAARNLFLVKASMFVLMLLVCVALVLKFWRQRKKASLVKEISAWELLELEFKEIGSSTHEDPVKTASQISLFIRKAYGQIIHYPCEDLTTDEMAKFISDKNWQIPGVSNQTFMETLKATDLVRFAGKPLREEDHKAWIEFVRSFWQACNVKKQEVSSGPAV